MRLHLSSLPSLVRRWLRRAITAIICAVMPLPAPAADLPLLSPFIEAPIGVATIQYPGMPGWLFFRTSSYCYATMQNEHGRLLIGYNRSRNEVHLGFWSDTAGSYRNQSRVPLEILMTDRTPDGEFGKFTRYWAATAAFVLLNSQDKAVFNFKLDGRRALLSLSQHEAVSFVNNDEMLEGFILRNSVATLRRLETCDPR